MEKTSAEKVLERLRTSGCSTKVIDHDPVITMDDVVRILDIPIVSMAKTILLFQKEIGLIAVVLPGMNKIDYAKIASILQVSRKTLRFADQKILAGLGLS